MTGGGTMPALVKYEAGEGHVEVRGHPAAFAVQLGETLEQSIFYLLQIRPMVTGGERADVGICKTGTGKPRTKSQAF